MKMIQIPKKEKVLIEVSCPCCGLRNYLVYKRINNYDNISSNLIKKKHIVICRECGFIFQNPLPEKKYLQRLYKESKDKIIYNEDDLNAQIRNYAMEKVSLLKRIKSRGRLLGIGSSEGSFLRLAQQNGYEVAGIEPSLMVDGLTWRENKTNRITIFKGFFEDYKTKNKYDIIMHGFVLEHIYEPLDFLRRCRRLIKADGIMVFDVPDITRAKRLSLTIDIFSYQHISHFTPETVNQLMNKAGWEVQSIKSSSNSRFRKYGMRIIARPGKINLSFGENLFAQSRKVLDRYFASLERNQKRILRFVDGLIVEAKAENKDIGIMGAGENCHFIVKNTDILKRCKVVFYDSNPALWGRKIYNSVINHPLKMSSDNLSSVILATVDYQVDMRSYLLRFGVKKSILRFMYEKIR